MIEDKEPTKDEDINEKNNQDIADKVGDRVGKVTLTPLEKLAETIKNSVGKGGGKGAGAEALAEGKRATKDAKKDRKKQMKALSGLLKNSHAAKAARTAASKAQKIATNHWGKLLLLGLFLIPKETWISIGKNVLKLFQFMRDLPWEKIFKELGNAITQIVDFLMPVFKWLGEKLFGKEATEEDYIKQEKKIAQMEASGASAEDIKEEKEKLSGMGGFKKDKAGNEIRVGKDGKSTFQGKNQGGLFGENRGIMDIIVGLGVGLGALGLLLAPGSTLLAGFGLLTGTIGLVRKALGKIPKLPSLKGPKPPRLQRTPAQQSARNAEAKRKLSMSKAERHAERASNKAKARAGGSQKVSTPKAPQAPQASGGKAPSAPKKPGFFKKMFGGAKKVASKGASAGGSALNMAGGWAKKFPMLKKMTPFLKKMPFIGHALTAGTVAMALNSGAGKKELIPMIGGLLGGMGGAALGGMIGGMLGLAGGPLAIATGFLGSIGGYFLGEKIAIMGAQYLMGEKVDWPWPFNDEVEEAPAASAPTVPAAPKPPSDIGGGKPPMSKNQFLQSEDYKGQMRGEDGVVAGESTAGKNLAFENYLKDEDARKNSSDKKTVDRLIDETRARALLNKNGKPIKGNSGYAKKRKKDAKKKAWRKFGTALEKFDPEWRQLALESLDKDELRYIQGDEAKSLRSERRQEERDAMTPEQRKSEDKQMADINRRGAGDAMFDEPIVTPAISPQSKTDALQSGTNEMLNGKSEQQNTNVNVGGASTTSVSNTSNSSTVIAQNPNAKDPFWDESF